MGATGLEPVTPSVSSWGDESAQGISQFDVTLRKALFRASGLLSFFSEIFFFSRQISATLCHEAGGQG
jgi:hypothetical protein